MFYGENISQLISRYNKTKMESSLQNPMVHKFVLLRMGCRCCFNFKIFYFFIFFVVLFFFFFYIDTIENTTKRTRNITTNYQLKQKNYAQDLEQH
jgi:hypothetical protein